MASGSSTKKGPPGDRRARAEAARKAAQRAEQRRRVLLVGGSAVAVVAILVAVITFAVVTKPAKATTFAAPRDAKAAISTAGLPLLTSEGQVLHIHDHLDVFVNGKKVGVPANLGIATGAGISPLHTHDGTGIVHVESPVKKDFTLGQFMKQWVSMSAECISTKCGGVTAYVDGKEVADPAAVVLKGDQEIVLTVGKAPGTIPGRYSFPKGL